MATASSILAQRIPMDRGAWQVMVHSVAQRVGHDQHDLAPKCALTSTHICTRLKQIIK